jgi:hypothetical protein
MPYGEHQALMQQEATAPMSASGTPSGPSIPAGAGQSGPAYNGVPFGAPTQRPNEPITHGVDIGPGGGSDVLPLEHQPQFPQQGPMTQMLSQMSVNDSSGVLATLLQYAQTLGA